MRCTADSMTLYAHWACMKGWSGVNVENCTYLRNWGKNPHPPFACLKVRYSSKVEGIVGSILTVLSLLQSSSPSNNRYSVHPLMPHNSESAMFKISSEIFWSSPHGNRTSPHNRWVLLAARISSSNFLESIITEFSCVSSSDVALGL